MSAGTCDSCAVAMEKTQSGCGYCQACCLRWHYEEMGSGPVIHSGESAGRKAQ